MPSFPKKRGKITKKRKFRGNQFTTASKQPKLVDFELQPRVSPADTDTCRVSVDEGNQISESLRATPSTPKKELFVDKIKNEYIEDKQECSGDFNRGSESERSDLSELIPSGNRIIDIGILCKNISSQLVCASCHGSVRLVEIQRQGLGGKFVFHCNNERCFAQKDYDDYPICEQTKVDIIYYKTIPSGLSHHFSDISLFALATVMILVSLRFSYKGTKSSLAATPSASPA